VPTRWIGWVIVLPEGFDLDGRLAGLQELPIVLQFRSMNLRPGLDEPLLGLRQAPAKTIERINREDRCLILIVRVEMCAVILSAGFHKHPDHNPEEAREFRHTRALASSELPCRANVRAEASASANVTADNGRDGSSAGLAGIVYQTPGTSRFVRAAYAAYSSPNASLIICSSA
jgi:hypothetical protein